MNIKKYMLATFLAFSITGCSQSLMVHKMSADNNQPQKGFVYPLLFTQFKITVTRGIASCTKTDEVSGVSVPDVQAFIKAEITSENLIDKDHLYVIDSDSLTGPTKTSDLSVKWNKGRLKSINAAADDQTAEVIKSVASGFAKLAISSVSPVAALSTATQGLTPESELDAQAPIVVCQDNVIEAVGNVSRLNGVIKSSAEHINELTESVTKLQLDFGKTGGDASVDCSDSTNQEEIICQLKQAMKDLERESKTLAMHEKNLEKSLKLIRHQITYRWPQKSQVDRSNGAEKWPEAIVDQWVKDTTVAQWVKDAIAAQQIKDATANQQIKDTTISGIKNIASHQTSTVQFKQEFDVFLRLAKSGNYGITNTAEYRDDLKPSDGIRYRLPAQGYLAVCKKRLCTNDDANHLIAIATEKVHQLGHIFNVPFESKTFTNRELKMAFDDNGFLETASMAQKESSAQNIADVFSSVADEVAAVRAAKAEAKQSELEKIQEQTALLNAQSELVAAQNALSPSASTKALEELKMKTDLAEAQKKYLDSLDALKAANASTDNEEAIATLNAETSLIRAETARLEAQLALEQAREAINE